MSNKTKSVKKLATTGSSPHSVASNSTGKAHGKLVQKHRIIKKIPSKTKSHRVSAGNGTVPHKYKVIKVIKRKKKLTAANAHLPVANATAKTVAHVHHKPAPHAHLLPAHPLAPANQVGAAPATTGVAQMSAPSATANQAPPTPPPPPPPLPPPPPPTAAPAATGPPPAAGNTAPVAGALGQVQLDARARPQSLTVSHDVLLNQPGSKVIHRADASGMLVSSNNDSSDLKPPPVSKEVIEWLTHERITGNEASMRLHKDIESQRFELMQQRQVSAARQMRLASRLGGSLMRETLDNDLTERLFDSELRRHDELRKQLRGRDRLKDRADQLQRAFSVWRRRRR